jgi:ketosteroid isomerase-like protein
VASCYFPGGAKNCPDDIHRRREISTNVETARAIHTALNARDWDGLASHFAEACMFTDGHGKQLLGAPQIIERYAKPWAEMWSDGRISQDDYYDAGETVIAEFTARGTNDGYFGTLPGTGLPVELACVHVYHFNDDGKVTFGRAYFHQLSLMQQHGYA